MGDKFTVTPYKLSEEAKSILKIKGDYSFFAIPTGILKKHNIESFDIIFDNGVVSLMQEAQGTSPKERTKGADISA